MATQAASRGVNYTARGEYDHYDDFLARMRDRFAAVDGPLFATDANGPDGNGLFRAYLRALPAEHRKYLTCSACRRFVRAFGHIVAIDDDGRTVPALWSDDEPDDWHGRAIGVLARKVRRAKVTGIHVSSERVWGQPVTDEWRHMAVTPPASRVYLGTLLSARQRAAELREDYRTLCRQLATHSAACVKQALKLLKDGSLHQPERFAAMAEWLLNLHAARAAYRGAARDNVTWLALATAPAGFAHFGNTVLGTVLEDIAAGLSFEAIRARYAEKMHPLQYQRPQAAPKSGAIERAEKIVAELESAGALRRRYARLDEVPMAWTPAAPEPDEEPGGVFAHLKPKGPASRGVEGRPTTITWEKFQRTVLPEALALEYYAGARGDFLALVTAADMTAPPLIRWDRDDARNPVSWYLYHAGSAPAEWTLPSNAWVPAVGITTLPPTWGEGSPEHDGDGAILLLAGMKDARHVNGGTGGGFFPSQLRGEYREIRSVMEAYAQRAAIEDADRDDLACGVDLRKGGKWAARVRATTTLGTSLYLLDRWD